MRHLIRQIMNPVLLAILLTVLIGSILSLSTFYFLVSTHAPFHGVSNPKYGLGGYEPFLYYLSVIISIFFCLRLPSYRQDSSENIVLTYRFPSNFLLSLTRVLAPTILVSGAIVIGALVYQAVASINVAIEPGILEPFEPWSLSFVLFNLFVTMFFWTSFGNLISEIFRSRSIGFSSTSGILIVQALVSSTLPDDIRSFTLGYSACDLYVSDIAPDDWGIARYMYWLSILSLSIAWISASSIILDRTDQAKRKVYKPLVVALISISMIFQTMVHAQALAKTSERKSWLHEYETVASTQDRKSTVEAIQGFVQIKPGQELSLDLLYTVRGTNVDNDGFSARTIPSLSMALNPGMNIEQVKCSSVELPYSHTFGILEIEFQKCKPTDDNKYEFNIKATGIPESHYLSYLVPHEAVADNHPQRARIMGQKTSLFTNDYVALTPLSHWYPQPLLANTQSGTMGGTELIDFSLTIDLQPESWIMASGGGHVYPSSEFPRDRNLLSGTFRSLGLLASNFHVVHHVHDEIEVNVLVHKTHADRLKDNELLVESLVRYINEAIKKLDSLGIEYPFNRFSIVEIPSSLFILNKNQYLSSGFDSILMFRESGVPFARTAGLKKRIETASSSEFRFLKEQAERELRSYWTNPIFGPTYEDVIADGILADRTYAQDKNSLRTMLVMELFMLILLESEISRFDFDLANELTGESRVNINYMLWRLQGSMPFDLRIFKDDYLNSHRLWESIERSFSTTEESERLDLVQRSGDFQRRERFRVAKLAELIAASFDPQDIANVVAHILRASDARRIDLELISSAAQDADINLERLFLTTLLQNKLPGIHFSSALQAEAETQDQTQERFRTFLDFRNHEDAPAFVAFEIVEFRDAGQNSNLQVMARFDALKPFELAPKTSYRLVMNTQDRIGDISANTFLSLNRGIVEIPITDVSSIPDYESVDSDDDNWFSISTSNWTPYEDQNVVIVDDLDPGFKVMGGVSSETNLSWEVFGTHLFRSFHPIRRELDQGLPSATYPITHSGTWARSNWGASWGRYRHTYVFAPSSIRPIQEVSFNAELDRAGRWQLSYHFPSTSWGGDYNIAVEVRKQAWNFTLESEDWDTGWTEIGTLHVEIPGKARVSVSNDSNAEYVFADAIKWTYLE